MSKATYYIRLSSYWQGAGNYFVGAFESREAAEKELERATSDENSLATKVQHMANNVKDGICVYGISTKTKARELGMRDYQFGDEHSNVIGKTIPRDTHELMLLSEEA